MKVIVTHLVLFLALSARPVYCQKEASIWLFDHDLGVDFNNSNFRAFKSSVEMNQSGASASMCDGTTGELLFFTNSRTVWDASFAVMKNGTGLNGGRHTQQAVLIVPVPGSERRFFIFTTKSITDPWPEGAAGLYYSIADMTLNNGLGAIIEEGKNHLLLQNASDKLIAVPHANGEDYWLITHEGNGDRFIIFPVTSAGIGPSSSFSFGPVYGRFESQGWLQASPGGTMLACAVSSDGIARRPLELYDFDNKAGIIFNRRELGLYPELIGVSFSPDNSKLYFTFSDQLSQAKGSLCQMDLRAGDAEAIRNSKVDLYALHDALPDIGNTKYDTIRDGVLQLAPDGRLYLKAIIPYRISEGGRVVEKWKIYFVDKPNLPGPLCHPTGRDFNVPFSSPNAWAFPNIMPHYFNGLVPIDNDEPTDCAESEIIVYPNPTEDLVKVALTGECIFPADLLVYDSTGKVVTQFAITQPFLTIDLSSLASGMYVMVFLVPHGRIVRKVIKT